jgi:hypothetical protein
MRALGLTPDEVESLVKQGVAIERDRDGRKRYEGEIAGVTIRAVVAVDRPGLVVTVYRRRR